MTTAQSLLRYLAEVAPRRTATATVVSKREDFAPVVWRPMTAQLVDSTKALDRLARLDRLHARERLLRVGVLWMAGKAADGQEVFVPLIEAAVSVAPARLGASRAQVHGDFVLRRGLVEDPIVEDDLNTRLEQLLPLIDFDFAKPTRLLVRYPTFMTWLTDVMDAMGREMPRLVSPEEDPWSHKGDDGVVLCPAVAVFAGRDIDATTTAGDLLNWAAREVNGSAFDQLYRPGPTPPAEVGATDLESPFPLNAAQREVIKRSQSEPIVVVSGPPGTGKSHLAAALATAEVGRGQSVLIATQSTHAADVITDLLRRHPGPRWVRFGDAEHRRRNADQLGGGMAVPYEPNELARIERRRDAVSEGVRAQRRAIGERLDRERAFRDGLETRTLLAHVAVDAPGAVAADLDHRSMDRLVGKLDASGWFSGLRRRRAHRRLASMLGAAPTISEPNLRDAIALASAEESVKRALASGGTSLVALWDKLEKTMEQLRGEVGRVIEAVRRSRENRRRVSTQSISALATALRAGRSNRRRMLRDLRSSQFLDVLPLWVGTLGEIDDTLPVEPSAFDVVIFDEASQIDQLRAAPALARGRRAVIVGDPRQLRHVSFVADSAMESAAARYQIDGPLARVLDIRRNSLFDVAAAASPVTWLSEHFRSAPHIIGYSNREFYDGGLRLMTQHPTSERRDAIATVVVEGRRGADGSIEAEIDEVTRRIRDRIDSGGATLGVVTPFRAQADAIEARVLEAFSVEEMDRIGLRVGTVHAFQGNERDQMIMTLGLGPEDLGRSLRFVEDPNLFNVMVTRARNDVIVVVSVDPAELPEGRLKAYLRYADVAPLPAESAGPPEGWVAELARRIEEYGLRVVADYPVAGYSVDLAVGEGDAAVGVECLVHPDGPGAHIERHLALRRAGWRMLDAFESRWLARPDAAVDGIVEAVLQRR